MIEFKPVRLEDRAVIERYTMPSGICNCDLAFANMYCWQAVFHSAWAEIGGFLVIRFQIDGGERIERIFNPKYPYEYRDRFSQILQEKEKIVSAFSR